MNNEFVLNLVEAISMRIAYDYNLDPVEVLRRATDEITEYFGDMVNISKIVYNKKEYAVLWKSETIGDLYPWNIVSNKRRVMTWRTAIKPVGIIENNVVTLFKK